MHNDDQIYRFDRNLQPVVTECSEKPIRPGEFFRVNARISYFNFMRRGIVVQPTFYIVCDEFTQMILGGLARSEKPNAETAHVALLSCFKDKVEQRGVPNSVEKALKPGSNCPRTVRN
jgi:hypothetical protein